MTEAVLQYHPMDLPKFDKCMLTDFFKLLRDCLAGDNIFTYLDLHILLGSTNIQVTVMFSGFGVKSAQTAYQNKLRIIRSCYKEL